VTVRRPGTPADGDGKLKAEGWDPTAGAPSSVFPSNSEASLARGSGSDAPAGYGSAVAYDSSAGYGSAVAYDSSARYGSGVAYDSAVVYVSAVSYDGRAGGRRVAGAAADRLRGRAGSIQLSSKSLSSSPETRAARGIRPSSFSMLAGLADGLAPKERRYVLTHD